MLNLFSKRRTLEGYACELPRLLLARYGNSATYTPGQVRQTVETAGLGDSFIEYAFALFLTKDDFERLYTPGNYTFLRADLLAEMAKIGGNVRAVTRDQDAPRRQGSISAGKVAQTPYSSMHRFDQGAP